MNKCKKWMLRGAGILALVLVVCANLMFLFSFVLEFGEAMLLRIATFVACLASWALLIYLISVGDDMSAERLQYLSEYKQASIKHLASGWPKPASSNEDRDNVKEK